MLEGVFGYTLTESALYGLGRYYLTAEGISMNVISGPYFGSTTDIQHFCLDGTFAAGTVMGCSSNQSGTLMVRGNNDDDSGPFPAAVSSIAIVHDQILYSGDGYSNGGRIVDFYT